MSAIPRRLLPAVALATLAALARVIRFAYEGFVHGSRFMFEHSSAVRYEPEARARETPELDRFVNFFASK